MRPYRLCSRDLSPSQLCNHSIYHRPPSPLSPMIYPPWGGGGRGCFIGSPMYVYVYVLSFLPPLPPCCHATSAVAYMYTNSTIYVTDSTITYQNEGGVPNSRDMPVHSRIPPPPPPPLTPRPRPTPAQDTYRAGVFVCLDVCLYTCTYVCIYGSACRHFMYVGRGRVIIIVK